MGDTITPLLFKWEVKEKPKSPYTVPDVAEDYHGLKPGTPEWMRFWKAHPEKQDEMLSYSKGLS